MCWVAQVGVLLRRFHVSVQPDLWVVRASSAKCHSIHLLSSDLQCLLMGLAVGPFSGSRNCSAARAVAAHTHLHVHYGVAFVRACCEML